MHYIEELGFETIIKNGWNKRTLINNRHLEPNREHVLNHDDKILIKTREGFIGKSNNCYDNNIYADKIINVSDGKFDKNRIIKYRNEIDILKLLDHENIIKVVDDYADEENNFKRLKWTEKLNYLENIATDLGIIHAKGFIHKELKYISLIGLMRDTTGSQIKEFGTNELEELDRILEKEDLCYKGSMCIVQKAKKNETDTYM
nr:15038_t:CDS:2 [Entrophospora candida]